MTLSEKTELKSFSHFFQPASKEIEELGSKWMKQETWGSLLIPWARPWARVRTLWSVYPSCYNKESLESQEQRNQVGTSQSKSMLSSLV